MVKFNQAKSQENLKKAIKIAKDASHNALDTASYFLHKEALKITPHRTGNLRDSAFQVAKDYNNYVVGYTIHYAGFVHEAVNHNFKELGTSAKFLEKTIDQNYQKIVDIYRDKFIAEFKSKGIRVFL